MATRDELVRAVSERYGGAGREERGRILDEFAAVTGLHRKHAMRLFRGGASGRQRGPWPGRRVYDVAVREALIVVWEASDRVCGKRICLYGVFGVKPFSGGELDNKLCALHCLGMLPVRLAIAGMVLAFVM